MLGYMQFYSMLIMHTEKRKLNNITVNFTELQELEERRIKRKKSPVSMSSTMHNSAVRYIGLVQDKCLTNNSVTYSGYLTWVAD